MEKGKRRKTLLEFAESVRMRFFHSDAAIVDPHQRRHLSTTTDKYNNGFRRSQSEAVHVEEACFIAAKDGSAATVDAPSAATRYRLA